MSQVKNTTGDGEKRDRCTKTALIALGSNVTSPFGPPYETLTWAMQALSRRGILIRAVSRFFQTPCFPAGIGPDYVNAACAVAWEGSANALMVHLHEIEADAARQRSIRWGQRTLDLDLIALEDEVWPDLDTHASWRNLPPDLQKVRAPEDLVVPHPRVQDRGFVLVPLADIARDWCHPILKRNVGAMIAVLDAQELHEIVPLGPLKSG